MGLASPFGGVLQPLLFFYACITEIAEVSSYVTHAAGCKVALVDNRTGRQTMPTSSWKWNSPKARARRNGLEDENLLRKRVQDINSNHAILRTFVESGEATRYGSRVLLRPMRGDGTHTDMAAVLVQTSDSCFGIAELVDQTTEASETERGSGASQPGVVVELQRNTTTRPKRGLAHAQRPERERGSLGPVTARVANGGGRSTRGVAKREEVREYEACNSSEQTKVKRPEKHAPMPACMRQPISARPAKRPAMTQKELAECTRHTAKPSL